MTHVVFAPLSDEATADPSNEAAVPLAEAEEIVRPAPTDAPPPTFRHPAHGVASRTWSYRNGSGDLVAYICRFDPPGQRKQFAPYTLWRGPTGLRWRWKSWPDRGSLYGLEQLAANPTASVVVVEGEKCADAARNVFSDHVVITSAGGARAARRTDWSPCAGRRILLWPDADGPGDLFAAEVAAILAEVGTQEIRFVDAYALASRSLSGESRQPPEGWDVADALAEGWSPDLLRHAVLEASGSVDPGPAFVSFPPFRMDTRGLTVEVVKQGNTDTRWLSAPFEILGRARNPSGSGWARWLGWHDDDGRRHEYPVPDAALHGDGAALASLLAERGLRIATKPADRARFIEYLNNIDVERRVTVVERTGWHELSSGRVFVLPSGSIGPAGSETVILNGAASAHYETRGTPDTWKESVGTLVSGHGRPVLAISAAFAGPLLGIVGMEGGGLNLYGQSSRGKTTCAEAAASVWGKGASPGYVGSWRSTANALEAAAAGSTDTVLALDEIGVVEAKEAAAGVYQLAAGSGKGRSARDGSLRTSMSWRVMVVSTGELPMSAKIAEGGRRSQAGQQVRMLDVPADAGRGFGCFDHGDDGGDASAISNAIKRAAREEYGTAGPAFVRRLVEDGTDAVAQLVRDMIDAFIEARLPAGADGQVLRAAARFAVIGAGGELATEWGITPWEPGEAFEAAARAMADWIATRGGLISAEVTTAIAQVRRFFETHGDSRFEPLDRMEDVRPVINRAGWRQGAGENREWYVPPETWKSEICVGLDATATARILADAGMLRRASDGFQSVKKIEGRSTRVYVLTAAILDGASHE